MYTIIVDEEQMGQEEMQIYCRECGAPVTITTKQGIARVKSNPISCPECNGVLAIYDSNGHPLNLFWAASTTPFELEILSLCGGQTFPGRVLSERFKQDVKKFGEAAIRRSAEIVKAHHESKPISTWLIADICRHAEKGNKELRQRSTVAVQPPELATTYEDRYK